MWVPFSQRVSLWASEEMVCFGNVFWDIRGGIWNLLGSYMYLVCTPGRNLAERSHSRLLSLSPHIQSINKSCQLYFQNVPGIRPPPSPSLTKAAAVISPWVTAVVSQLGFPLVPLSPATCVPHDHQLATGRASSRTFQWVPMSLGEKLPLSPSPPAVLVVWVPLTFWTSFPATFPGAVPSVSSLWVPYHFVSISTNTLYVLPIFLRLITAPSCMEALDRRSDCAITAPHVTNSTWHIWGAPYVCWWQNQS